MSRTFRTKEFKVLEDLWYKKLKATGFEDIEPGKKYLKFSAEGYMSRSSNKGREAYFASKEEYFRLAGHFLYDHQFENETDRFIWERHAEGESLREIVVSLKSKGVKKALTQVKETIHRLRAIMLKDNDRNSNG